MDPLCALGVVASIAGILTAASEAAKILGPYASATKDAPKIASQMFSEVLAAKTILIALRQLADNLSADNVRYASLIRVDDLVAVLTDGVFLFDELESLLCTLPTPESSGAGSKWLPGVQWSSVQWIRKKGAMTAIFTRLQAFKASTSCILNILQSDSLVRAEAYQQQLISGVNQLLGDNFMMIGQTPESPTEDDTATVVDTSPSRASFMSQRIQRNGSKRSKGPTSPTKRFSMFELNFVRDLEASGVYRRVKRETMDYSFRSSMARSDAWSIYSGMSLGNISQLSVLALPVYRQDIVNSHHYHFSDGKQAPAQFADDEAIRSRSIFHRCLDIQWQLEQLPGFTELISASRASLTASANGIEPTPLSVLRHIFRTSMPLLRLWIHLDDSNADLWKPLLEYQPESTEETDVSQTAMIMAQKEFAEVYTKRFGVKKTDLPTPDEMSLDSVTAAPTKLVQILESVLFDLGRDGKIPTRPSEPMSARYAIDPTPLALAIHEFLRDERLYLSQLDCLQTQLSEVHIYSVKELDITEPSLDTALKALDTALKALRALHNTQLEFLQSVEMMALKPSSEQDWDGIFEVWERDICNNLVDFAYSEKDVAVFLGKLLSDLHKITPVETSLRFSVPNAIGLLNAPMRRLKCYRDFVEELVREGHSGASSSMTYVCSVEKSVTTALEPERLRRAHEDLLDSIEESDASKAKGSGRLLIYDVVSTPASRNAASHHRAEIYVYQYAVFLAINAGRRGRLEQLSRDGIHFTRSAFARHPGPRRSKAKGAQSRRRIIHSLSLWGVQEVWSKSRTIFLQWDTGDPGYKLERLQFRVDKDSSTPVEKWVSTLTERKKDIRKYSLAIMGSNAAAQDVFRNQITESLVGAPEETDIAEAPAEDGPIVTSVDDEWAGFEMGKINVYATAGKGVNIMSNLSLNGWDGFFLTYSTTDQNSFDMIPWIYRCIRDDEERRGNAPRRPVVLVSDRQPNGIITTKRGKALADAMGAEFFEIGNVRGADVVEAFSALVRMVRRWERDIRPPQKEKSEVERMLVDAGFLPKGSTDEGVFF